MRTLAARARRTGLPLARRTGPCLLGHPASAAGGADCLRLATRTVAGTGRECSLWPASKGRQGRIWPTEHHRRVGAARLGSHHCQTRRASPLGGRLGAAGDSEAAQTAVCRRGRRCRRGPLHRGPRASAAARGCFVNGLLSVGPDFGRPDVTGPGDTGFGYGNRSGESRVSGIGPAVPRHGP